MSSGSQRQSVHDIASFFDVDGSGMIPSTVVHEVLAAAGISPTSTEVQALIERRIDTSRSGSSGVRIAISDVVEIYKALKNIDYNASQYKSMLSQLDASHVDLRALSYLLQHYGVYFSKAEAEQLCTILKGTSDQRVVPLSTVTDNLLRLHT